MKILLAVDGSKASRDAVTSLVRRATWFREPPFVHLLYVHLPVPRVGAFAGPSKAALTRYYSEEGALCLSGARGVLDKSPIRYEASILVGPIAGTICKEAAAKKCELIWMGTRGMGSGAGLLLGSTATKVLHASKVPVMLVK